MINLTSQNVYTQKTSPGQRNSTFSFLLKLSRLRHIFQGGQQGLLALVSWSSSETPGETGGALWGTALVWGQGGHPGVNSGGAVLVPRKRTRVTRWGTSPFLSSHLSGASAPPEVLGDKKLAEATAASKGYLQPLGLGPWPLRPSLHRSLQPSAARWGQLSLR